MDTAAELGRNPVSKHQIQPEYELSRLTRDGTAKPVSRDQILTRERGQEHIDFPCSADHVQDWQPYPVMHTLAICVTIHKDTSLAKYSNTVCSTRVAAVTVILLDYNRLYNYGIVGTIIWSLNLSNYRASTQSGDKLVKTLIGCRGTKHSTG